MKEAFHKRWHAFLKKCRQRNTSTSKNMVERKWMTANLHLKVSQTQLPSQHRTQVLLFRRCITNWFTLKGYEQQMKKIGKASTNSSRWRYISLYITSLEHENLGHTCGSPGTTRIQSLHPWMRSCVMRGLTLRATCTACVASLSMDVLRTSDAAESWLMVLSMPSHIFPRRLRGSMQICTLFAIKIKKLGPMSKTTVSIEWYQVRKLMTCSISTMPADLIWRTRWR